MSHVRPLKFNKPAKDMLLDILNFTNKAAFEKHQLEFGVPRAVSYDTTDTPTYPIVQDFDTQRPAQETLTEIDVKASTEVSWTGCAKLTYSRLVLQDYFVSVPFVVYAKDLEKATVLAALREQYNLYLDDELFDYRLEVVDLNQVLYTTHMGSIVDDEYCEDFIPPVSWNVILTAKPEHPIFIGSLCVHIREAVELLNRDVKKTLEIKRYMGPGNHDRMPAEMILPMNRFVDNDFSLHSYKVGDLVMPEIVDVAKQVTGDEWVFTQTPSPFNLYAAKVVYNGLNTGEVYIDDPKCTNLLIIEFSRFHSTNIVGQWIIGYYDRGVWLRRYRVDAQPFQDI